MERTSNEMVTTSLKAGIRYLPTYLSTYPCRLLCQGNMAGLVRGDAKPQINWDKRPIRIEGLPINHRDGMLWCKANQ